MEHYYTKKPKSTEITQIIQIKTKKDEFELETNSGLFSKNKLDKGSQVLIENMDLTNSHKVLDIGCGYGTIGISILREKPETELTMIDVNERAIKQTIRNLKKLNLKAKVKQSNLYEKIKDKYDLIISNPPISAGRKLNNELIIKSKEYLNKNGSIQIVCKHRKGGEYLQGKIEEVFGNCEILAKKSGYRVYKGTKKSE